MTNDEIDAAIRAAIVGALPEYGSADLVSTTETDFAIYRAGYAAGLERAARLAEERRGDWYKLWNDKESISVSDAIAAAIRALNTTKEK